MDIQIAKYNLTILSQTPRIKDFNIDSESRLVQVTTWFQRVIRWFHNLFGGVDERVRNAFNESMKLLKPDHSITDKKQFTAKVIKDKAIEALKPFEKLEKERNELLEILECPISLETLNEPQILPSGQTFSKVHLDDYINRLEENNQPLVNPSTNEIFEKGQIRKNLIIEQITNALSNENGIQKSIEWQNDPILRLFKDPKTGQMIEHPVVGRDGITRELTSLTPSERNQAYPNLIAKDILDTRRQQLNILP